MCCRVLKSCRVCSVLWNIVKLECGGVLRSVECCLWSVVECVVECYRGLWWVVEYYGVLWSLIECYGVLWSVVECCGVLWSVVECGVLWGVVKCCGLL